MTNKPSAELPAEMKNIKILIGHSFWQSLSLNENKVDGPETLLRFR